MFSLKRLSGCVLLGSVLVLSLLLGAPAQPVKIPNPFKPSAKPKPKPRPQPKPAPLQQAEIIQEFPSNDAMKTAWKVHYATQRGFGLIIQDAFFKKGPMEPWIQVLGDARVSELFVPYHSGTPRFWDISYNFELCAVNSIDAGPHGKVLGRPPVVVHEVRDRGIAWVDSQGSRRGQTMVLRATIDAANYRYVIEYGFQDDGVINFRVGSTGRNYASREWEGHMHNALWRIDVNLDGPENNSVYVMEHQEPAGDPAKAETIHRPFNEGREGWLDWNADRFTMLQVRNESRKNSRGMLWSYDLVPARMGNARHFGNKNEACTQHDFWVTRANPKEIYYVKLPEYVQNAEPIMNTDVVLWYSAPGHHHPRSEDGEMLNNALHGVTPIMWAGFDLKPRDIWDRSPYYRAFQGAIKKKPK
jgi:primary-amine oxidase